MRDKAAIEIHKHINAICSYFKLGARVTILARIPGNNDADMVLTQDDIPELIKLLERQLKSDGKNKL